MWFVNRSIRYKLLGAFALLVLLALVLGLVALRQLSNVHARSVEVNDRWLPSIIAAGELSAGLNRVRRVEARLPSARNQSEFNRMNALIQTRLELVEASEISYEHNTAHPEASALMAEYRRVREAYDGSRSRLLNMVQDVVQDAELTGSLDADRLQDAREYYTGSLDHAFENLEAHVVRLQTWSRAQANAANQAVAQAYRQALILVIAVLALAILAAIVLALTITRSITQPTQMAVTAMQAVARGDLAQPVHALYHDEMGSLLRALETMRERLANVVARVRNNAEGVATASEQIAQGNNDLSMRTEQQASALEEIAASMEELGSTVHQNAEHANLANQMAISTTQTASDGGQIMQQAVQTMQRILESGKQIEDIIAVIDNIAFQTNILALNAAVEAARAGEQGRGFAVVASEVRNLAQRSAESSKEVKALIAGNVQLVSQGGALIAQAGDAMENIVQSIRRVTDLVGEISAASTEQSAGVAQVGEAIVQLDQVTQRNAALVEESAAAAASLSQQAQALVASVEVFRLAADAAPLPPMHGDAPPGPSHRQQIAPSPAAPAPQPPAPLRPAKTTERGPSPTPVAQTPVGSKNTDANKHQTSSSQGDGGWESF